MGQHLKSPLNLALTETSFFGIASLGSAQCLLDCGRGVIDLVQCCGGVSSSALVAAVFLTAPEKTKDYLEELYGLVDVISPLPYGAVTPDFDLIERMRVILNDILPMNAHDKASAKLIVKGTELRLVEKYSPLTVHDVDQGSSSCLKTKGPKFFEVGEYCWQLGDEIEMTKFSTKEDLVEVKINSQILFICISVLLCRS
ncbi:Patatin-like phospholipase domain-containing protein 4 [Holothuria leucospilota]|uniref:Patatin-like phospholipase domain-containing protein 4 n=1 Tax=Holothuria leucospilota TaxID=206669 RepID=A0A9Q1BG70_HOLLE|nr:Patatin-like phospholipase domain-containing protein 4 [Holothuria leucospilota]